MLTTNPESNPLRVPRPKQGDETQGFVLLCSPHSGEITKVVAHVCPELPPPTIRQTLFDLIDTASREKLANFLQCLREQSAVSDWEIVFCSDSEPEVFHLAAVLASEDTAIVIGSPSRAELVLLTVEAAQAMPAFTAYFVPIWINGSLRPAGSHTDTHLYDALSSLNNELANAQRDLVRSNARLDSMLTQLRSSERQSRAIYEAAGDAIVVLDDSGTFLDINPATAELFGASADQLVGHTVSEYLLPDDRVRVLADFRERRRFRGEFTVVRPDGSHRYVEHNATADFLPDRHLAILHDITERRLADQAIRELNESLEHRVQERTRELQESNAELEAFSYSVSHDLRAPFRHIAGFSDLLQKRLADSDETAKRYVGIIAESAAYAGTLVDNLLSFSRMGRTELQHQRFDMRQLVDDVVSEFSRESTPEHPIRFHVGDLPTVTADSAMMRLVLVNLVSNAIKYSRPKPESIVEIGSTSEPGRFVFYVKDNGVGFDMRYAHKLFGVFQRLHRMEDFEGTGIGLANVRRIVQRHKGSVWAESQLGSGSTFFFSLPRNNGEEASFG